MSNNKKSFINTSFPIFVINLAKDIDKKEYMSTQAKKLNLDITFIDAVYGKDLDQKEVDDFCNHEESIKVLKRQLFRGEVGVAMSQMSIYKRMIDKNIKRALVLEDDAEIFEGTLEVLNSLSKFPEDWEVVMLGYYRHFAKNKFHRISFRKQKKISKNYRTVRFTEVMHGAHGYMISLSGAKKLFNTLSSGIVEPVDHYTGDQKYINLYGISPRCIGINDNLQSTIVEERVEYIKQIEQVKSSLGTKDKLKTLLRSIGLLDFLQTLNGYRGLFVSELSHLMIRLQEPKKYT